MSKQTMGTKPATPLTDALSSDPAIERRDVPARVWREMARLEQDRARLVEALRESMNALSAISPKGAIAYEKAHSLLRELGEAE